MNQSENASLSGDRNSIIAEQGVAVARIRVIEGVPRLLVHGKLTPPLLFWTVFPLESIQMGKKEAQPGRACGDASSSIRSLRSFAEQGIHLFSFPVSMREWWIGRGKYDFRPIDERLSNILNIDEEGKVLVRVDINPPGWWFESNPDERMILRMTPATPLGVVVI